MATGSVPKLRLQGLKKRFGPDVILDGVSFDVRPRQSLVLLGESGAGKTLLFKILLGLITADDGSIELDGSPVGARDQESYIGRFGVLFQRSALFDSLPVWQNVAFRLLQDNRLSKADAKRIAVDKLAIVGLDADVAELLPAEISGGMQKRVGFARAIATDPEILLLDEPTAGLDPIMTTVINQVIARNVKEMGATALSITNDVEGATQMSDTIAMIDQGRICWIGATADIERSGHPSVERYIHNWQEDRAARKI